MSKIQSCILAFTVALMGLLPGRAALAQAQCSRFYSSASWISAEVFRDRLSQLSQQEIYAFPKIQLQAVDLHPFAASQGRNNMGTYWALLNGQKVFVKEVAFPNSFIVREMAWMQLISELGLGPKLIGFMRTPSGQTGIVSEWVSGRFIGNPRLLSQPPKFVQAQMAQIQELFKRLQIKPIDFQFFIDEQSRIRIVDVGLYTFSSDGREIDGALSIY